MLADKPVLGCFMSNSIDGLKFDICCAARALYRAGLSAGIAGHLSVAIGENKMLMNRFGPSFGTLRPADICAFDFHGRDWVEPTYFIEIPRGNREIVIEAPLPPLPPV